MADSYHHGDLRDAVVRRAVEVIAEAGVEALNLRSLAADLGVSHTAPRYHFGDRRGILTAIATEGFATLADRMSTLRRAGSSFLDQGVAYVEFALAHPAHFHVMFNPTLFDNDNGALLSARSCAFAELRGGVDTVGDGPAREDAAAAVVAAWAMVHGIAVLGLSGNLDESHLRPLIAGGDLLDITRRSASLLYRPRLTHGDSENSHG